MTQFKVGDRVKVIAAGYFLSRFKGYEGEIFRINDTMHHVRFADGLTDYGLANELKLVTRVAAAPKIKVGDRVRVTEGRIWNSDRVGKAGVVDRMGGSRVWVKFDDGERDYGHIEALERLSAAVPAKCPKVGDRVRIKKAGTDDVWETNHLNKEGEVYKIRNSNTIRVRFSDGATDYGRWDAVEIVTEVPTVEFEGGTYTRVVDADGKVTLTPVPAKPAPRAGQIWRLQNGQIVQLTEDGRNTILKRGGNGGMTHEEIARDSTLIAPSLAEAIEGGLITAANLR